MQKNVNKWLDDDFSMTMTMIINKTFLHILKSAFIETSRFGEFSVKYLIFKKT